MTSLVLISIFVTLLANLPLFFMILFVHSPSSLTRLWGLAPNQFLFPSLFFPFAAASTLLALRRFIMLAEGNDRLPDWLLGALRVWPAFVLLGIAFSALVSCAVYFGSSMSLDKLKTDYAVRACMCADFFNDNIQSLKGRPEDVEKSRLDIVRESREMIDAGDPPVYSNRDKVDGWLEQLDCTEYLQVVHDPKLQRKLGLLDGSLFVLSGIQLLVIMTMAGLCVFGVIMAGLAEQSLASQGLSGTLTSVLSLLQMSVLFYAAFALCYRQHRREVEWLTGNTSATVLQDVFVGLIAFALLTWIGYLIPSGPFAASEWFKFLPALLFGAGAASQFLQSGLFRRLIGVEAGVGTQLMVYLMVILFGSAWFTVLVQRQ